MRKKNTAEVRKKPVVITSVRHKLNGEADAVE